jgi:hypothetical protein
MVSVAIGNGAIGQGHLVRVNWSGSIGQIARLSVVRFLPDTARFLHPIVHLWTSREAIFFGERVRVWRDSECVSACVLLGAFTHFLLSFRHPVAHFCGAVTPARSAASQWATTHTTARAEEFARERWRHRGQQLMSDFSMCECVRAARMSVTLSVCVRVVRFSSRGLLRRRLMRCDGAISEWVTEWVNNAMYESMMPEWWTELCGS